MYIGLDTGAVAATPIGTHTGSIPIVMYNIVDGTDRASDFPSGEILVRYGGPSRKRSLLQLTRDSIGSLFTRRSDRCQGGRVL